MNYLLINEILDSSGSTSNQDFLMTMVDSHDEYDVKWFKGDVSHPMGTIVDKMLLSLLMMVQSESREIEFPMNGIPNFLFDIPSLSTESVWKMFSWWQVVTDNNDAK